MKNIISSFFKMNPLNALILFLLFWIPFWQLTPRPMFFFFTIGIILNIIQYKTKYLINKFKFIYLIAGLTSLYLSTGTWKGIDTGVGFLGLLALVKLLTVKERKDYFLYLLILQLFLCTQLLSSESLYIAFYLMILCPLLFLFMHFSIKSKTDNIIIDKARKQTLLKLFLTAIPIALVLLIIFPRLQLGNFFFSTKLDVGKSGYVEKLSPGEIAKLIKTDEIVFRASFMDKKPAVEELYWRGAILDKGFNFNWSKGKRRPRLNNKRIKEKPSYKIEYDKLQKGALFTLDGTTSVKTLSKASVFYLEGNVFESVPYSNQKLRYLGSFENLKHKKSSYFNIILKKYLETPPIQSSELKSFIKSLRPSNDTSNEDIVNNLILYYKNNDFKYSLSPGKFTRNNQLEEFLFNRRIGFCEHYAGASASILRLAGVPTRVVSGFQGGDYSQLGNYFIVRSRDAHAWLEYWSKKQLKWKRFDPVLYVAPERIQYGNTGFLASLNLSDNQSLINFLEGENTAILRNLLLSYDFAYYRLNTLFLSYDLENQISILKKYGIKAKSAGSLFLYTITLVFILVIVSILLIQFKFKHIHPADKILKSLLKKLDKDGYHQESNETTSAYLKRLNLNENQLEIARLYDLIKYSNRTDNLDRIRLKKLIKNELDY